MAKVGSTVFGVLGLLFMAMSCADTRLGGMTVRDAFPDERVAKLVEAIAHNDYVEADKQIKAGANINMVGNDGISPLLWVFGTRSVTGTEYLLKAGANPNYRDAKRGVSAMSIAAGGNRPDLLELLLRYKGDTNLLGPRDQPLLHIAVSQLRKENIELLLRYGADVNVSWGPNATAAQTAARLGQFDLTAYLLEHGLNARLDKLALTVEQSRVPPNSEAQRWKDKVIEMLKARGVQYPPTVTGKPS